jgi:hypothetical protein
MAKNEGNEAPMSFDREMEDTIHQIILACGIRPLKEKVSLLYLTIDYIFSHNKDLIPSFQDKITLH